MEIKKYIALVSLIITLIIFVSILAIGVVFDNKREDYINKQFEKMANDFNNMQTLFLMTDTYDNEMICLALENKLKDLDRSVWDIGQKLDNYRAVTEEFQKSDYYKEQKILFNENEVFYFLLLKKMIEKCNISKEMVLFFYQNSADCRKCDDQSFILSDINDIDDKKGDNEIAMFSLDTDLGISSIDILSKYYEISSLPCIVVDGDTYCGILDKSFIMEKICLKNPTLKICSIENFS